MRTLVRIKNPQAAMITLDVRMGPFESDERDVLADTTAIFLMLDSPLLTIQVLLPTHVVAGGPPCQMFTTRRCPATMAGRHAAFQGLPGCTRGRVLNRLITHQGRRVA